MITGKKFGLSARLRHRLGATRHTEDLIHWRSATKTLTPTTKIHRDLASFITDASARSLIRQALRATRSLADAQTRESAVEEIKRTVRATPRTSGKEATAKALSEARRRLREFEEMILMAR